MTIRAILLITALLAAPVSALAGVKKYITPVAPSGSTLPGTATYNTTYVCDTLADLTAITGSPGDLGMVGTGAGQMFIYGTGGWIAVASNDSTPNAVSASYEYGQGTLASIELDKLIGVAGSIDNSASGDISAAHPNSARISTSNNAAGRASSNASDAAIVLGGGTVYYDAVVRLTGGLSTGSQRYQLNAGIRDSWTALNATDGCYFRYKDDVNSGKWECVCISNSVESTPLDSGVTVDATTWYRLSVQIDSDASVATFYVNGTSVGAITNDHIPSGTGRETSWGLGIIKTIGTTAAYCDVDYQKINIALTTAR